MRALLTAALVLTSCKTGLGAYAENGDDIDVGDGEPPALDPVARYRNDDRVRIEGVLPPGATGIVLVVESGDTAEEIELPAAGASFFHDLTLSRGEVTAVYAVAVTPDGPSAASNTVVTEACDPADVFEITAEYAEGYGDDCEYPVFTGAVSDDAGDEVVYTGNAHEDGDIDWYRIAAVDAGGDAARGFENFRLQIDLVAGTDLFQMAVVRGSCDGTDACGDQPGYDSYSFFSEDTSPDPAGDLPTDRRACGAPPLDECPDYSGDFLIRVERTDGSFDCSGYTLRVSNGAW